MNREQIFEILKKALPCGYRPHPIDYLDEMAKIADAIMALKETPTLPDSTSFWLLNSNPKTLKDLSIADLKALEDCQYQFEPKDHDLYLKVLNEIDARIKALKESLKPTTT